MNLRPRGLMTMVAASVLTLMIGCEARIDSGTNWNYRWITRFDLTIAVRDNAAQPLAGATVRLYLKVGDGAVFLTYQTTNDKGEAVFPQPDLGQYLVTASKDGYLMNSTFAIVAEGSVVANDLRLARIVDLPDIVQANVPQSGGTVSTQPVTNITQSSVTFGPGVLTGDAQVTLGTLTGQAIPVPPSGQVPLTAVLIQATAGLSGSATVNLGLPFDLPNGTQVPVFAFNESTSQWTQIATGTVQAGEVVASIQDLGTISALASFVPRRTQVSPDIQVVSRPLSPSDGEVIETKWTPRLTFPDGTNYSDKTKTWIRGTIEQLVGLKFDQEVTTKLRRDPAAVQVLSILQRVDRYTISVFFTGTKPTRLLTSAGSADFMGDAATESAELQTIGHNSGFGGGG